MKQMALFSTPNPNDREELIGKAYIASKWLKIISIISLVLVSIVGLLGLLIGGVAGAAFGFIANGSAASSVAGAALGFIFALIIIIFSAALSILTLWYTSKLKFELENGSLPDLTLAYVLIVLTAISALSSIIPHFNIIGLLINIFWGYLFFTVIQCVTKLQELGNDVNISSPPANPPAKTPEMPNIETNAETQNSEIKVENNGTNSESDL